ncbi:MAG: hypothetical protein Q9183_003922 [Haloplaca sp. 2 TL-2023]
MTQNLQKLRDKIVELEQAFRRKPDPVSMVVYARMPGNADVWKAAFDSQIKIVQETMEKWKVPYKEVPYTVMTEEPRYDTEVEVLVDPTGDYVRVYVEDKLVFQTKK